MKPVVLIIRDGWGYRSEEDLNGPVKGNTPYTDYLMSKYPKTNIGAAGMYVGLPEGYQGNSEVGHMTIGAGRIFYQSLVKINKDIESGVFFEKKELLSAIENCKKNNSKLHICGLLQKEGVHAHINHCLALLDLCKKENFKEVLIHVITDGRDAPVKNSIKNVKVLLEKINELGFGKIVTISGRYYSMDRDKRWERTEKAYRVISDGFGDSFQDPIKYIEKCYDENITDEFILPKKVEGYSGIENNDSFIFYNYRSDRPRQLTMAIVEDNFCGFTQNKKQVNFYTMTEYYKNDKINIIYSNEISNNILGEIISKNGMKQLRISETEKYAHVTFFFNNQIEKSFEGEERILIPSPKVATYDLKPEMSVDEIGDKLVNEIDKDVYSLIVVNFVNGDMVGHTGNWEAVLKAVNAVDRNLEKVVKKILEKKGTAIIFGDHGNCEDMTEDWRTSHTLNKVPLILVNEELLGKELKSEKGLQDIAPTVLKLLDIEKPDEMTGESLF